MKNTILLITFVVFLGIFSATSYAQNSETFRPNAVVAPANTFKQIVKDGLYEFNVPSNWNEHSGGWYAGDDKALTPEGGFYSKCTDGDCVTHGIIFGVIKSNKSLIETTRNLIDTLRSGNSYLEERATFQTAVLSGHPALVSTSSGYWSFTKSNLIVVLYTVRMPNGDVFFISTDVHEPDFDKYQPVFERIIKSIRFYNLSSTRATGSSSWQVTLDAREYWYDTGISVSDAASVNISATGAIIWNPGQSNGSAGPTGVETYPSNFNGTGFPNNNEHCGALLMKIGNNLHTVGNGINLNFGGNNNDTIKFMVNDSEWGLSDNSGTFNIQVNIVRNTGNGNRQTAATVTGYVDVVEPRGQSCYIRLISGENVYVGTISFEELSQMAGYPIRTYEEAVRFLNGRQVKIALSGLTYSSVSGSVINFGKAGQIIFVDVNGTLKAPQWTERTTSRETVLDLSADILFDFNSADLKPESFETLLKLAQYLRETKSQTIELNGFTDSIGSDVYNLRLSERRAAAVKQWLVTKGGIVPARLLTKGCGKTQPVAPNTNSDGTDNPEGRQKNRRVEVRIPRGNSPSATVRVPQPSKSASQAVVSVDRPEVTVTESNGVVTLSGQVADEAAKKRAYDQAVAQSKARIFVNNIMVVSKPVAVRKSPKGTQIAVRQSPKNIQTDVDDPAYTHIDKNHRNIIANWIKPGWRPATKEDALQGLDQDQRNFAMGEINSMPNHPFYVSKDFNKDGAVDFAVVLTNESKFAVAIFNGPFVAGKTYTPNFYSGQIGRGDFLFWMTDRQFGNRFIVGPPSSDAGYIIRPHGRGYRVE